MRAISQTERALVSGFSTNQRRSSLTNQARSYWIPGAYTPTFSKKRNSFLRLLKNKGFKEESMTKVGLYAIGISTTLESNKSLRGIRTSLQQVKNEPLS